MQTSSPSPRKTLGLFGFGQFGKLAARHLSPLFDLRVYDTRDCRDEAAALGVQAAPLPDTAACDIVVLGVPMPALAATLEEIVPHLKPGALVLDVVSVKMLPAQLMLEKLPPQVDIVATHPLFGPQSGKHGLQGLPMAVCPVRGERHTDVAAFCRALGLRVEEVTAEEHDREMAYVQALTHLIGRALAGMNLPGERLSTQSYRHLLDLCALIGDDSFEMFTAIQTDNPFAADVTARFVEEVVALRGKVGCC